MSKIDRELIQIVLIGSGRKGQVRSLDSDIIAIPESNLYRVTIAESFEF
ncbi:MAG: hypothetical protein AAFO04_21720 [Cyanobacteria bacterium J06592_8]